MSASSVCDTHRVADLHEGESDPAVERDIERGCQSTQDAGLQQVKDAECRRNWGLGLWLRVIREFTPSWFLVIMGTGIVSILLQNHSHYGNWLYWISVVIFASNVVLFASFFLISILRYAIDPKVWLTMIRHPSQSLFLGAFPMGLATIIDMFVFVCVPIWGAWTVHLAWALWCFDVVVSLATCCYLPFMIMYVHDTRISQMNATWLLPIVAPIVAAASGAIVADVLPNAQHALWTMVVSYIMWGSGILLTMVVLVIYFHRLTVYRLPPREVIVSVFLPLGPLGQGGFAVMRLGAIALKIIPKTHTLDAVTMNAGEVLYVIGWLIAIFLWGFGLVWLFFAVASITRSRFPFNIGWWGSTFPLGVFTLATTTIGTEMPSEFFRVLGIVLSVCVTFLWAIVIIGTIRKAYRGHLSYAPCLKDIGYLSDEKRDMEDKIENI